MALLDFPTSPNLNDTTTQNGNTWKWNGTSWVAFNNLSLSSQVTGVLGTVYGGTGKALSGLTVGSILYADSTTSFAALAPSTSNYVLATQGNGLPPYWKVDDSGTGSVGSGATYGFTYYNGLNTVTSGTAFSYIVGSGAGGVGGTVVLTSSTMALIGSTITSGTWAGSAITLLYGGTNGSNSGIAVSYQIAVYNSTGTAITQIATTSSIGNSVLFQASQDAFPKWVGQSQLLVGSATTAAGIVLDSVTATRYLIGASTGSSASNAALSTGSGITIGNNSLTSGNIQVTNSTASFSTSTGALTVTGGVGIGGSLITASGNTSIVSGVSHYLGSIIGGTWAGTAIALTYGGTNGSNSGLAVSYQIAVYNSTGTAITQIATTSSIGNSVLFQASQDAFPKWVGQSQLLVGSATTAAGIVLDSVTATRYLIGASTGSSASNAALSTGSGITIGNNSLTSGNIQVTNSTASFSTSTGALTVTGGVGIGGSLITASGNTSIVSGVSHYLGSIIGGTWAGTAIALTYGGTNGSNSGLAVSYQMPVYNSTGTAITQIATTSSIGNSVLFQASQDALPKWVGQSQLLVGSATTAVKVGISSTVTDGNLPMVFSDVPHSFAALGSTITLTVNPSSGKITNGIWAGSAITTKYGGTGLNTVNQNDVLIGASTGNTWTSIGSTWLPVVGIGSNPPGIPGGAIGNTQPGQLWWDSQYGVLKIYYSDQGTGITVNSQWVDATPVLGSSGGGSSTKRSYVMSFGAGFTPTVGADTVQILIPHAPDNTSKFYYIKRLNYRNETVSGGTGASFFIERFTGGNAAFSNPERIYSAGAGAGASFIIGASTYTASWTLASTGASFISSSGVAGSVISGDYLRLNFTTVGSAAAVSVSMIIEEQ